MKKVKLFIAISLDGYIADVNSSTDWLGGEETFKDDMISYREFIEDIDTVVMGANTYRQIAKMSQEWVYSDMKSYVITHEEIENRKEIVFTSESASDLVKSLREESGKSIWICGGAMIVNELISEDLIDEYTLNVMPIILGDGIKLFDKMNSSLKLRLVRTINYNGITDLVYERRRDKNRV